MYSKENFFLFFFLNQIEKGNPSFLFQQGKPRKRSIFGSAQTLYMHIDIYILPCLVLLPKQ